jgi:hypothetical protein
MMTVRSGGMSGEEGSRVLDPMVGNTCIKLSSLRPELCGQHKGLQKEQGYRWSAFLPALGSGSCPGRHLAAVPLLSKFSALSAATAAVCRLMALVCQSSLTPFDHGLLSG